MAKRKTPKPGGGYVTVGPVIRPGPVKPTGLVGTVAFNTKRLLGICTVTPTCAKIAGHGGEHS